MCHDAFGDDDADAICELPDITATASGESTRAAPYAAGRKPAAAGRHPAVPTTLATLMTRHVA